MNAPSIDFKDMLEAYGDSSGLDVTFATNIHIGKEPSNPKNCITIYDTNPGVSSLGMNNVGYEYPAIQIKVRNISYIDGWNIIHKIKEALHGRHHEVWGGTLYQVIYCSSGPALLDWDDNGCVRFIINFNLQRR